MEISPSPMRKMIAILGIALAASAATSPAQGFRHAFDFSESNHGFADHPQDFDPALYNLVADHRPRPQNLGSAPALFIGGSNRSDDLFMFWKKQITGLPPNAAVRITMEIEFASNAATGLVGIGGAPGEGVILKAGAVPFEPSTLPDRENWRRMNLDKGNQSLGGANMSVLGHIGKPDDGTQNHALLINSPPPQDFAQHHMRRSLDSLQKKVPFAKDIPAEQNRPWQKAPRLAPVFPTPSPTHFAATIKITDR
jgi:hypothetical protein